MPMQVQSLTWCESSLSRCKARVGGRGARRDSNLLPGAAQTGGCNLALRLRPYSVGLIRAGYRRAAMAWCARHAIAAHSVSGDVA